MNKINFDKLQKQIKGDFFFLCGKNCAGMCERYYISYYLPGEDEYVAEKLVMSLKEFRDKFVTVLKFKDGSKLDLLRITSPCPFLNFSYHCTLEKNNTKLVACKMYPFGVMLKEGKQYSYLDYHCPLVWNKQLPEPFVKKTRKALEALDLPKKWLQNVGKIGYFYDYDKLAKLSPKEITYEELQKCLLC